MYFNKVPKSLIAISSIVAISSCKCLTQGTITNSDIKQKALFKRIIAKRCIKMLHYYPR